MTGMALTVLVARFTGFALYRLQSGAYAGWRLRELWRRAPLALVSTATAPGMSPRDTTVIALFLAEQGIPTQRVVPSSGADEARTAATLPVTTPAFGMMTDLPGQEAVRARLTVALKEAACGEGVAVVCIALDRREALVQQFGEGRVEEIITTMGARLLGAVADPGGAGRLGHGVFVAVFPLPASGGESSNHAALLREAQQQAEALRAVVAAPVMVDTIMHTPATRKSVPVPLTVRMGIAVAPVHGVNASGLLLHASQGMTPHA